MSEDMASVRHECKEIDMEKLISIFPSAAGLILAVYTTSTEPVAQGVDPASRNPIHIMVHAALDPPDEYAKDLQHFADLFGLIGGIFKQAAEGTLDPNYPEGQPVDAEPEPPEFIDVEE